MRVETPSQSDSDAQGFIKTCIDVRLQPPSEPEPFFEQSLWDQPRLLAADSRPKDYLPRTLAHIGQLTQTDEALRMGYCRSIGEYVLPLKENKGPKRQKYNSLEEKYNHNPDYTLVYYRGRTELESNATISTQHIHSLSCVLDYNSKDYSVPSKGKIEMPFDSEFEEGNLLCAFHKKGSQPQQFDLIMQNDTNTLGYSQWFYFRMRSKLVSGQCRINIVNFVKKHGIFIDGARPVCLSVKNASKGWHPCGANLTFGKSYIKKYSNARDGQMAPTNYYTLSFTLKLDNQDDTLYLAMNYPYTYTQMVTFINQLQQKYSPSCQEQQKGRADGASQNQIQRTEHLKETQSTTIQSTEQNNAPLNDNLIIPSQKTHRISIQQRILCYSLSNNPIPLLKIIRQKDVRKEEEDGSPQKTNELECKKQVLIIGRQHPGESVGSFALEGFITYWLNILESSFELENYELIVIPMLNVDGVIYGNFRTNLAGLDLNRQFHSTERDMHPESTYLKRLISSLSSLSLLIDFHGHSKMLGAFTYSCWGDSIEQFRLLPHLLSKNSKYFQINQCTFSLSRDKAKTARVTVFRDTQLPQIHTLETSFLGYKDATGKVARFTIDDLFELGSDVAKSAITLLTDEVACDDAIQEIRIKGAQFAIWAERNNAINMDSDSNPSEDGLTPQQWVKKVAPHRKPKAKAATNPLKRRKARHKFKQEAFSSVPVAQESRPSDMKSFATITQEKAHSQIHKNQPQQTKQTKVRADANLSLRPLKGPERVPVVMREAKIVQQRKKISPPQHSKAPSNLLANGGVQIEAKVRARLEMLFHKTSLNEQLAVPKMNLYVSSSSAASEPVSHGLQQTALGMGNVIPPSWIPHPSSTPLHSIPLYVTPNPARLQNSLRSQSNSFSQAMHNISHPLTTLEAIMKKFDPQKQARKRTQSLRVINSETQAVDPNNSGLFTIPNQPNIKGGFHYGQAGNKIYTHKFVLGVAHTPTQPQNSGSHRGHKNSLVSPYEDLNVARPHLTPPFSGQQKPEQLSHPPIISPYTGPNRIKGISSQNTYHSSHRQPTKMSKQP